jgi:hypothetical protein
VVPGDFDGFFAAVAGASAALVRMLFVAISVAPQRLVEATTRAESQTLAGSALIAFINALVVATIALIPGVNVGWAAAGADARHRDSSLGLDTAARRTHRRLGVRDVMTE